MKSVAEQPVLAPEVGPILAPAVVDPHRPEGVITGPAVIVAGHGMEARHHTAEIRIRVAAAGRQGLDHEGPGIGR